MVKELNHVAVRVADMDASVKFYKDVLGGTVIRDAKIIDGGGRVIYVQLAEGVVELISSKPGDDNLGLQHIAFLLADDADLDTECIKLKDRGYKFTIEPRTALTGVGRLAFFEDKSGVIFELIQRKEDIRIPDLKNEHILEFDHISIRIFDDCQKECADLFVNTMGFKIRRVLEAQGNVMTYYSLGADTIGTLYGAGKPRVPKPLDHFALRVSNCFEMKKYLETRGVVCPSEPFEAGLGGFYILNISGPDGEMIKFLDRPSLDEFRK